MPYDKKRSKKGTSGKKILLILLIVSAIGVGVWLMLSYLPFSPFASVPSQDTSTFTLISSVDGEDVSWVEIDVLVPKDDVEFEDYEDIFTRSNFEVEISSRDAEDVSIDLTPYSYIWIEIDPDGETVFENDFILLTGGSNYNYIFYVYDLSSDVNFNIMDESMSPITVGNLSLNANYTVIMDVPHYTTSGIHANGNDWTVDSDDWDDMTASEKEFYYDEANFRSQAPLYNPSDDLSKDYDHPLEKLTEAFAIKLTFNTTVSTVDGNAAQVNITVVDDDEPIEVVVSGTFIFLIFYDEVKFNNGPRSFRLEMVTGSGIGLDNAHSGRLEVPYDDRNLGTFTAYSAIGA